MKYTDAIINQNNYEPMLVTWDTGRRCNYNCTYCEATRHDNHSAFHDLNELIKTFEFVKKWSQLYNSYRKYHPGYTNINFTGGEPTMNPNFWDLVNIINVDDQNFRLSLTTNGAWNKKYTKKILKRFSGITVSYHAEGHENLKKLVMDNIIEISKSDIRLQVNVMLHEKYWDECIKVYETLFEKGINVKPRPIGDGNLHRPGWFMDSDGEMRKTIHHYNEKQKEWFYSVMGEDKTNEENYGDQLGRACCGGRCLSGKTKSGWENVQLVNTEFKNWFCTVDWFFLHIDQHTGEIYHHQTCKALPNGKTGSLGNIKNAENILKIQTQKLAEPVVPLNCPNNRCGCGMCSPKAKNLQDFKLIWSNLTDLPLAL